MRRRFFNPLVLGVSLAALSLAGSVAPSAASVTIGQLAPSASSACDDGYDWLPNNLYYVVPANGTIISWSHIAAAGAGQTLTMKIWRHDGFAVTRIPVLVVGHDGPHALTEGTLNTFPTSIPVEAGDILGLHTDSGGVGCLFSPGGAVYKAQMNAGDGEHASFTLPVGGGPPTLTDYNLNVSAVLEPPTNSAGSASRTSPARSTTKCKELRKKLKRQRNGLANAGSEAKLSMIQDSIADTKKRLKKLAC